MSGFKVYHTELLISGANTQGVVLKFLLNDHGIAFLPATRQHREVKFPGLSYEDDYRGNALAGLLQAGRAELRFHQAFADERVRDIWAIAESAVPLLATAVLIVTYQGRRLK